MISVKNETLSGILSSNFRGLGVSDKELRVRGLRQDVETVVGTTAATEIGLHTWSLALAELIKKGHATCAEVMTYNDEAIALFQRQYRLLDQLLRAGIPLDAIRRPPQPTLFVGLDSKGTEVVLSADTALKTKQSIRVAMTSSVLCIPSKGCTSLRIDIWDTGCLTGSTVVLQPDPGVRAAFSAFNLTEKGSGIPLEFIPVIVWKTIAIIAGAWGLASAIKWVTPTVAKAVGAVFNSSDVLENQASELRVKAQNDRITAIDKCVATALAAKQDVDVLQVRKQCAKTVGGPVVVPGASKGFIDTIADNLVMLGVIGLGGWLIYRRVR